MSKGVLRPIKNRDIIGIIAAAWLKCAGNEPPRNPPGPTAVLPKTAARSANDGIYQPRQSRKIGSLALAAAVFLTGQHALAPPGFYTIPNFSGNGLLFFSIPIAGTIRYYTGRWITSCQGMIKNANN
jgi:hypothetical protein